MDKIEKIVLLMIIVICVILITLVINISKAVEKSSINIQEHGLKGVVEQIWYGKNKPTKCE